MTVTTLKSEGAAINFTMSGECPHCSVNSAFAQVTQPYAELIPVPEQAQGYWPQRICAALQCNSCKKFILGVVTRKANLSPGQPSYEPFVYEAHYPVGPINDFVAPEVPTDIGTDFQEALRCRSVRAYNATVEMCRRAIESSCLEQGAKGDTLFDKIDFLANNGIITKPLRGMAHKIRLGGNRGAHPSQKKIEERDADAVVDFTRHYFEHVYVMPAVVKKYDFSQP